MTILTTDQNLLTGTNEKQSFTSGRSGLENWKILKLRIISHIRLRKMAEKLVGIKEDREDTDVEEFSRFDRFMIHPDNRRLFYFNQIMNFLVMADIIYSIEL